MAPHIVSNRAGNWHLCRHTDIEWYSRLSLEFKCVDSVVPPLLPSLDLPLVGCASDYSGSQKASDFLTLSYLWFDPNDTQTWETASNAIRQIILGPFRTMSYKGLNDLWKRRALHAFLAAADELNALLLTFAIHKDVEEFKISNEKFAEISKRLPEPNKWRRRSLEDAVRAAWLFAFGAAGMTHQAERINWLTDNDVFTTPKSRIDDLHGFAIQGLIELAVAPPRDLLIESSSHTSLPKRTAEDILSIPDLVAGCLAKLMTAQYRATGTPPLRENHLEIPDSGVEKASNILEWHLEHAGNLSKVVVVLYPPENKGERFAVRVLPGYEDNAPYCRLDEQAAILKRRGKEIIY